VNVPWPIIVVVVCAGILAGAVGMIFIRRVVQEQRLFDLVQETRTIFIAAFGLVLLTVGLALVSPDKRDAVFTIFGGTLAAVVAAVAGKASVDALAGGSGLKGIWKTLTTDQKPDSPPPPTPPTPPPGGTP